MVLSAEYDVEHYPSQAEKLADWWVHAVGLTAAAGGGLALLILSLIWGGAPLALATGLYALCLIAMLACSAAYNLTRMSDARPFLRRLDEAGIFLMIAGSYTPFTTQRFTGGWAIGMTALVWAVALGGVLGKLLAPQLPERLWTLVYVAFGWLAVIAIGPLISGVPLIALILLVVGGLDLHLRDLRLSQPPALSARHLARAGGRRRGSAFRGHLHRRRACRPTMSLARLLDLALP